MDRGAVGGTKRFHRSSALLCVLVVGAFTVAGGCTDSNPEVGLEGAEPLGEEISLESALSLASIDWGNATYLSACGLSDVKVRGGVGEASSMGVTYGVEVIDADVADLDGDGSDDAAVLVDCLGGDSYSPHVVVVPGAGVRSASDGNENVPLLAIASGGSLPGGDEPVDVEVTDGGGIVVVVLDAGKPVERTLQYAQGVLAGGELPARPGETIAGVLLSAGDGVAVVSVTPDSGYRLVLPADLTAVDPDLATAVPISALEGRDVTVAVGDDSTVSGVLVAPTGP